MLIPLSFRFLFLYGEGDFFRVESHMDVSPKIYQVSIRYGRGRFLRWSYLFALNVLFIEWLKKVRFDLTDFISLRQPNRGKNCRVLFVRYYPILFSNFQ